MQPQISSISRIQETWRCKTMTNKTGIRYIIKGRIPFLTVPIWRKLIEISAAKVIIRPNFISSLGWKVKPPNLIQRFAPRLSGKRSATAVKRRQPK